MGCRENAVRARRPGRTRRTVNAHPFGRRDTGARPIISRVVVVVVNSVYDCRREFLLRSRRRRRRRRRQMAI